MIQSDLNSALGRSVDFLTAMPASAVVVGLGIMAAPHPAFADSAQDGPIYAATGFGLGNPILRLNADGTRTAPNAVAALAALDELEEKWGAKYRGMIRLWRNAWTEFVPFLDYDAEIRKVICSTNAIESLNSRYRRAVRAPGHFPTEQAALKCLYLVTRSLDPTGTGRARWTARWKPVINAFAITFGDRWPDAGTY